MFGVIFFQIIHQDCVEKTKIKLIDKTNYKDNTHTLNHHMPNILVCAEHKTNIFVCAEHN